MADELYAPYRVENESAETIRKRNKSGNIVPVKGTAKQVLGWDANGVAGAISLDRSYLTDTSGRAWIPASSFVLNSGAPDLAARGATGALFQSPAWAFDGTARESVATFFDMPSEWNQGSFSFRGYWTPSDANTGNLFWAVVGLGMADGTAIDVAVADFDTQLTIAMPGVARQLTFSTTASVTVASTGGPMRLVVVRYADIATDTYDGHDAWFFGLRVSYTATI